MNKLQYTMSIIISDIRNPFPGFKGDENGGYQPIHKTVWLAGGIIKFRFLIGSQTFIINIFLTTAVGLILIVCSDFFLITCFMGLTDIGNHHCKLLFFLRIKHKKTQSFS